MIEAKEVRAATVYHEEGLEYRWLDAIGTDVKKFIPQCGTPLDEFGIVTLVNSAAAITPNLAVAGELFSILTTAAEYDGACFTLAGESFDVTKPFYFGIRMKTSDATASEFVIGLGETLIAYMAAAAHTVIAANLEIAGFHKAGDATVLNAISYVTNVKKVEVAWGTAMDANFHTYEVFGDGTTIYWYMDGVEVTTTTGSANLPDGDLTPVLHYRAAAAAAKTLKVAWMRTIQIR